MDVVNYALSKKIKRYVDDISSSKQVQSDWNQSDESASDYVKNRPFYGETVEIEIVSENAGEYLLEGFPEFAVGDTVTVKVDGTEYSLVAFDDDGVTTIGDAASSIKNGEGQLGWLIVTDVDEVWFYATEAHTVSYLGIRHNKLDKKYMPDEVLDGIYEAQIIAYNAKTTADNAKTTANNAKTTADNAQTTADNAVKRITSTVELVFGDNSTPPIGVGESLSVSNKKYTSVDHKKGDTLILGVSFKYLNSNGNQARVVLDFILTFKNYYGLTGIAMSNINDTPTIFVLDANNAGNGSATLMRIF